MEVRVKRNAEYPDELMHFKYIKRVKKDGKWKYYYDVNQLKDDLGVDEREAVAKKTQARDAAAATKDQHRREMLDNQIRLKYDTENLVKKNGYNVSATNYAKSMKDLGKANVELAVANEKYARTPLGKLDNAINKGSSFLADKLGITKRKAEKATKEEEAKQLAEQIERTKLEESERKKQIRREKEAAREAAKKERDEKQYSTAKKTIEAVQAMREKQKENAAKRDNFTAAKNVIKKQEENAAKNDRYAGAKTVIKRQQENAANNDRYAAAKNVINKQQENAANHDRYAAAKNVLKKQEENAAKKQEAEAATKEIEKQIASRSKYSSPEHLNAAVKRMQNELDYSPLASTKQAAKVLKRKRAKDDRDGTGKRR